MSNIQFSVRGLCLWNIQRIVSDNGAKARDLISLMPHIRRMYFYTKCTNEMGSHSKPCIRICYTEQLLGNIAAW